MGSTKTTLRADVEAYARDTLSTHSRGAMTPARQPRSRECNRVSVHIANGIIASRAYSINSQRRSLTSARSRGHAREARQCISHGRRDTGPATSRARSHPWPTRAPNARLPAAALTQCNGRGAARRAPVPPQARAARAPRHSSPARAAQTSRPSPYPLPGHAREHTHHARQAERVSRKAGSHVKGQSLGRGGGKRDASHRRCGCAAARRPDSRAIVRRAHHA